MENHPRWSRQLALEEEMKTLGRDRFWQHIEKAQESGREATTGYGMKLMKECVEPLSTAVREFVREAMGGGAGRRHTAAKYLNLIEPEVAAYLTLRQILDEVSEAQMYQSVAVKMGRTIEDELRMRYYRNQSSGLFDAIRRKQGKTRRPAQAIRNVARMMKEVGVEEWEKWPESDCLHLGQKLIELMVETTGIVEIYREVKTTKRGARSRFVLRLTEDSMQWINKRNELTELLMPSYLPTIIPPRPWTTPFDGGYWSLKIWLVKTKNTNYLEDLKHHDMPVVYEAVSAIQETAWKVNPRILETLSNVWDSDLELGKLPPREDYPLPTRPVDIDTNPEALKKWKKKATEVYEYNAKTRSKRLQVLKTLWVAEKFKDEPEIYFPHTLDFRGRVYAMAQFLNPQGCDYSKALLTFAKGKPIEDEEAAEWLAIHGANTYGYDKSGLRERVAWVYDHQDEILACAKDPLSNRFWCDADKPWQFLAFCFEWQEFQAQGYGYVSSLPIALDGTCNGLQHFSAMLRDSVGGQAVNLVPSKKPEDIYQRVADRVIEKLREDPDPMAAHWLAFGIDRKTTKRSVMVVPYGGTRHACRAYVRQHFQERALLGEQHGFGENTRAATDFLAHVIWDSIGDVVIAARSTMTWLQKIARVISKEGQPIMWLTPAQFPVRQAYPNVEKKRVKTHLHGSLVYLTIDEELTTLDPKQQVSGISPNFVHSMDGAALQLSVCKAKQQGIDSFAMIHDSYGTVAADTVAMGKLLREAFVEMYQKHDVLQGFLTDVREVFPPRRKLPPVPPMGTLNIERVLESDFFFA